MISLGTIFRTLFDPDGRTVRNTVFLDTFAVLNHYLQLISFFRLFILRKGIKIMKLLKIRMFELV